MAESARNRVDFGPWQLNADDCDHMKYNVKWRSADTHINTGRCLGTNLRADAEPKCILAKK